MVEERQSGFLKIVGVLCVASGFGVVDMLRISWLVLTEISSCQSDGDRSYVLYLSPSLSSLLSSPFRATMASVGSGLEAGGGCWMG